MFNNEIMCISNKWHDTAISGNVLIYFCTDCKHGNVDRKYDDLSLVPLHTNSYFKCILHIFHLCCIGILETFYPCRFASQLHHIYVMYIWVYNISEGTIQIT